MLCMMLLFVLLLFRMAQNEMGCNGHKVPDQALQRLATPHPHGQHRHCLHRGEISFMCCIMLKCDTVKPFETVTVMKVYINTIGSTVALETLVCIVCTCICVNIVVCCIVCSPFTTLSSSTFSKCSNVTAIIPHVKDRSTHCLFVAGKIYSLSGGIVTIYIHDDFCTCISL